MFSLLINNSLFVVKIWNSFKECELCVCLCACKGVGGGWAEGDKHAMKNSMIKRSSSNYLKSGRIFLNSVICPSQLGRERHIFLSRLKVFKSVLRLNNIFYCIAYFIHLNNIFYCIKYFTSILLYCIVYLRQQIFCVWNWTSLRCVISRICYFVLIVYFTVLDYMFIRRKF